MKGKITITYEWWRDDGKRIKAAHKEALKETALDCIMKMVADGYESGELMDNIYMTSQDPKEGVGYSGSWEMS